jgi:hypothetical protein
MTGNLRLAVCLDRDRDAPGAWRLGWLPVHYSNDKRTWAFEAPDGVQRKLERAAWLVAVGTHMFVCFAQRPAPPAVPKPHP